MTETLAAKIKIAAVSLGCAKNRVDTEEILGLLGLHKFVMCDDPETADLVIVNTCSFIEDAQQESIDTILKLSGKGRKPKIIAAGCLAERYGEELLTRIPELAGVIGVHSYSGLVEFLHGCLKGKREALITAPEGSYGSLGPRLLTTPPHSVYVKVAEGCDNHCRYCLIPSLRGPFRSRQTTEIVQEVADLVKMGTREINLIAQDTTSYGRDLAEAPDLADLLQELLHRISDPVWFRILYAYPTRISHSLLKVMASDNRICRYLDLPLQHIDNKLLPAMGRFYSREDIAALITKIRQEVPGIALRTTFMTGFPGETREQYLGLLDFMQRYPFERIGAFSYSPQEGTEAAGMPGQIPTRVKERRRHGLLQMQQSISLELNRSFTGKRLPVLVEGLHARINNLYFGRSQYQAPEVDGVIYFKSNKDFSPGDWASVKIIAANPYNLLGVNPRLIQNPTS